MSIFQSMSKYRTCDVDRLTAMFKALSNPQRLRIFLKLVSCCGPSGCCSGEANDLRRCVGDLGRNLGLAASTVSHHIKELRHAGLMQVERRGQRIECWISPDTLHRLAAFFNGCCKETDIPNTGGDNAGRKK